MPPFDDQDAAISDARARSLRFVQIVFASFALIFVGVALAIHHAPQIFTLPHGEPGPAAASFLYLAAAYAATLLLWERIFGQAGD